MPDHIHSERKSYGLKYLKNCAGVFCNKSCNSNQSRLEENYFAVMATAYSSTGSKQLAHINKLCYKAATV